MGIQGVLPPGLAVWVGLRGLGGGEGEELRSRSGGMAAGMRGSAAESIAGWEVEGGLGTWRGGRWKWEWRVGVACRISGWDGGGIN